MRINHLLATVMLGRGKKSLITLLLMVGCDQVVEPQKALPQNDQDLLEVTTQPNGAMECRESLGGQYVGCWTIIDEHGEPQVALAIINGEYVPCVQCLECKPYDPTKSCD